MTTTSILLIALVILVAVTLAVLIALASAASSKDSDTVEYQTRDGVKISMSKWQAMKLAHGAHATYYFDENHNLKRRSGC